MRLRVVQVPDREHPNQVPSGNPETGMPLDHWCEGVVVMLGNEGAPDHVTVFNNGTPTFYQGGETFTPRVEDWSDVPVVVLQDEQ